MNGHQNITEEGQSLWALVLPPALWLIYFLFAYIAGALWCGAYVNDSFLPLRIGLTASALPVLAGIGMAARAGWRRHSYSGGQDTAHDEDTEEDRHQFLGFATLLLALLSAVATVYVALSVAVTPRCF